MAAVSAGSKEALEQLYDRHASLVMGVAFRITSDRALAEEIVQDVFWRVWRQADRFDKERGQFGSWLTSIARNMAIDSWRRKIRTLPTTAEVLETRLHTDAHHTPDQHWIAERGEQVREAIKALPEEQRLVIELAYFHGKTRREIAAESDLPLGTIHTRARLALQKLRLTLVAQGLGDYHE